MPGFVPEKRTIGGREFTVGKLSFADGQEMLVRVMGVVAPLLGEGAKAAGNGPAMMAGMLAMLGTRLDNAMLEFIAEKLGAISTVKTGAIEFKLDKPALRESAFDGDYLSYFEWLAFGLEVQYRDFFVGLLARLGQSTTEASQ
jgi:hypothetical protein